MDLAYRLNDHSKLGQAFRKIFQPATYLLIGSIVKIALLRHRLKIINRDVLISAWKDRPPGTPLITVSNHHSCLDDFILFGSLFSLTDLTKGIPIWRTVRDLRSRKLIHKGGGVDQPSMNFTLQVLNQGGWVHIFPQGRIIHPFEFDRESNFRLKWGVGRLLAESNVLPLVLPIWHCGLELLNPSETFSTFETLRRIIGKPRTLTIAVEYRNHQRSEAETRREVHSLLTALVQAALYSLKSTTELEHQHHFHGPDA
ncbi:unnamed protein product [Dicrocoelium dendriticum]|nr:unnamed protein product [Dicrocoelium dendriticum]